MDITTSRQNLEQALSSIDWKDHISSFLGESALTESVAESIWRLAVWARQLEESDRDNPALAFVREMQTDAQYVPALAGLALYRPAATMIRGMVEAALYYTYFRTHSEELSTLLRDPKFFLFKSDVVDYHKCHSPDFSVLDQAVGLISKLDDLYKRLSAIAHGQIPGKWLAHTSLAGVKPTPELASDLVRTFVEAEEVVHYLFLCTVGQRLWPDFSSQAKAALLRGLSGDVKTALKLDLA